MSDFAQPHASGFTTEGVHTVDKLYDSFKVRRKGVIPSGAGVLLRSTAMGRITDGARTAVGAAGVPAPAGATITASPVATTAADVGVHRFVCATAGAVGKWNHFGPGGELLGQATTGTQYVGGGLTLTITDSGTDPAVGEAFTVTITEAAASGKWIKSLAAATDGSEVIRGILLHDVDATDEDAEGIIGRIGSCNGGAVVFGAGHTLASVDDACLDRGLIFETVIG